MSAPTPGAVGPGDDGDPVRDVQRRLRDIGAQIGEDGHYGIETEAAVRAFQTQRGLHVDGHCGPETWSTLVEASHRLGDRLLYLTSSPMLRGDDVALLQRRLGALGFDAGRVDGIFGPDTAGALEEFQRNVGLTPDSICGPDTVAALRRLGGPADNPGPVANLPERERRRHRPVAFQACRVAVAHPGGLDALTAALARELGEAGAEVLALHDPDPSRSAQAANDFDADVIVGLRLGDQQLGVAYYGREDYESPGGRVLAAAVSDAVAGVLGATASPSAPMTVPLLRETRMPAVLVHLAPAALVVERAGDLARAIAAAVATWADAAGTTR